MKIKAKASFTKVRMKEGLSMNQLAEKAGVPVSIISRMENGKSIVPKTAKAIRKALNKSFEELFIIEKENHYEKL